LTVAPPSLVMVAGPNGAGKTTLIETLRASPEISLPPLYINADDLGREDGLDARDAQALAASRRQQAIAHGQGLLYETVMSHPSKVAELQAAAAAGYLVTVVFVATNNPEINIQRVALRVAAGGHDVPRDRIRVRHRRSLALASSAIAFAAHAYVYDNSAWGSETAHQLQAVLVGTTLQPAADRPSSWVTQLIDTVNPRAAELQDIYESVQNQVQLILPNLDASATAGPITVAGKYYVLQTDQTSGNVVLHDRALLTKPISPRQIYRIEYSQGVSKISRRSSARIRAVKRTKKQ
jgi:predicted ABC-type ATPase